MRTPLIIFAAIGIVVSTAAAANFDVNAGDSTLDDIASGSSSVESCTDGVTVELATGDYNADADDWPITSVTIANAADGVSLADVCEGFTVSAVLEGADLAPFELAPTLVNAGLELIELPLPEGSALFVGKVTQTAVLIDRSLADGGGAGGGGDGTGGTTSPGASVETSQSSIAPANPTWKGLRQPFVAHATGSITRIELLISAAEGMTGTIDVFEGLAHDATPIGRLTMTRPAGEWSQWVSYIPFGNIPLTSGTQYSFRANYVPGEQIGYSMGSAPTAQQFLGDGQTGFSGPGTWGPNGLTHRVFID